MAATVAKRRTPAKRKPSAAKKRKAKVSASTLKMFGKTYKKVACGLTKTEATAKAETHRAKGKGKGAAVKKNAIGVGYCLYKRG